MKSSPLSSINKGYYQNDHVNIYDHSSSHRPLSASASYDNFIGFTSIARMCIGRRFMLCAKTNPHIRTYSIRLDAGCIMSDYNDW